MSEIGIDKSQLDIMQRQNKLLEIYEGRIQALLQEKVDAVVDEDIYEEKKEDLRKEFLSGMNNTLKEVDISTPEIYFKNLMAKALLNQIKRGFGYYEAMMELRPIIKQYNMQIGDEVLESLSKGPLDMIEKLEKVVLIAEIVRALKLEEKYAEKVVSLVIEKEFGHKK